jgi:hypothetical protein
LTHVPPYFCPTVIGKALTILDKTHYDTARKI